MLAAPVLLLSTHEVEAFSCGVESLDLWLKRRALNNQITGASRMFVVGEKDRVAAYYALAFGAWWFMRFQWMRRHFTRV